MRFFAAIDLLFFFALDVVRSTLRVAAEVLTPGYRMRPGIIALNVEGMTKRQLFFMMNLVAMTPGSMGVGLSADRRKLYLHIMYLYGPLDQMRQTIEQSYGKRVRRVF